MKNKLFFLILILFISCKNKPETYYYQYESEISDAEYNKLFAGNISNLSYDTYYELPVGGSNSNFSQSLAKKRSCKSNMTITPAINDININDGWYKILVEYKLDENNYFSSKEYKTKIRLGKKGGLYRFELYNVTDGTEYKATEPELDFGDYENGKGYFNLKEFYLEDVGIINSSYKFEKKRTITKTELRTKER